MKNLSKLIAGMVCWLGSTLGLQAQDSRYSQPLNNPLALNGSMMALQNDFRVYLNYRNQWGNIDKGYQNYGGSVMYPLFLQTKKDTLKTSRLDFGLNVMYEKAGAFKRTNANLSVGYGIKLSKSHLISASLNVGFLNYRIDWSDQTFDEQYVWGSFNENNPNGENTMGSKNNADVGFGLLWRYMPEKRRIQAFLGVSGFHLNQPNLSFIDGNGKVPARFNFQAGVKLHGKKIEFSPVLLYSIQSYNRYLTAGFLAGYSIEKAGKIVAGVWYKEKQAIALQLGFEHKNVNISYSYDFASSALSRATRGLMTHELCLIFKHDFNTKKGVIGKAFY